MVIRVTHIYRRIDGEWKLVHRHADFPPPDQRTTAASSARANDPDRAAETLAQARRMDPGQVTAWIGVLTEG